MNSSPSSITAGTPFRRRLPWTTGTFVRSISAVSLLGGMLLGSGSLAGTGARAASPVTLNFWNGFTGPDGPAVTALVKQFNASHPDIQINMTIEPWDTLLQKLPLSLRVGKGPDIAGLSNQYIPQYAQAGLIQPIDSVYGSGGLDKSVIPSGVRQILQYNGHYYAAPMTVDPIMMYWNKTLFKKAGLSRAPTTWSEWQADAVKLSKHANGADQYGLALADNNTIPNWPIFIWDNGGDIISADGKKPMIDSPKSIAAVSQWANLMIKNRISPPALSGADADKLFQTGKAAMEMTGPWATSGFTQAKINYDVAMVPKGAGGPVTAGNADVLVLSKSSSNLAQAKVFMTWWNSKSAEEYLAIHSGHPPVRTDMRNDPKLSANPWVHKFAVGTPYARFYLGNVKNYAQIDSDVITPALQSVEFGKQSAKAALSAAASKMAKLL
ncbi:MAG: ABC transporter substrate-binding protein [Chloroflexota bacterium]